MGCNFANIDDVFFNIYPDDINFSLSIWRIQIVFDKFAFK